MMAELYEMGIREIHAGLAAREFSAAEVAEATASRIETLDHEKGGVNAFLEFTPEMARQAAVAVDEQLAAGKTPVEIGPLAGIPMAFKDNMNLLGTHTTCASHMLEDYESMYTATCVQRTLDAGALPMGKLNMYEFAFGATTETSATTGTATSGNIHRLFRIEVELERIKLRDALHSRQAPHPFDVEGARAVRQYRDDGIRPLRRRHERAHERRAPHLHRHERREPARERDRHAAPAAARTLLACVERTHRQGRPQREQHRHERHNYRERAHHEDRPAVDRWSRRERHGISRHVYRERTQCDAAARKQTNYRGRQRFRRHEAHYAAASESDRAQDGERTPVRLHGEQQRIDEQAERQ